MLSPKEASITAPKLIHLKLHWSLGHGNKRQSCHWTSDFWWAVMDVEFGSCSCSRVCFKSGFHCFQNLNLWGDQALHKVNPKFPPLSVTRLSLKSLRLTHEQIQWIWEWKPEADPLESDSCPAFWAARSHYPQPRRSPGQLEPAPGAQMTYLNGRCCACLTGCAPIPATPRQSPYRRCVCFGSLISSFRSK